MCIRDRFVGKQEIPVQYKTTNINDELAKRYTKLLIAEFHNTRRELMITGKEVMQKLIDTEIGQKTTMKDRQRLQDVITEEYVFTGKDLQHLIDEYGTLPCFAAIEEIKPNAKLKKMCNELGINQHYC